MYRTGIANPTQLAMLTRIMTTLAQEMNIEETSPRYDELAAHLMILFEASKNEQRLLTLMRRSAGFLHTRLTAAQTRFRGTKPTRLSFRQAGLQDTALPARLVATRHPFHVEGERGLQ